MVSQDLRLLLLPDEKDEQVVLSREEAAKLRRKLEEQEAEIARLREKARRQGKELDDLRRQLAVHVNPNVPPSVRNHAPGFPRARPRVPPEDRKKPGPKAGHPGTTRGPRVPDRKVSLTADTCGHCHSHRLRKTGTETQQEVELPPPRKAVVTEYGVAVYQCLDCGAEIRATLPDGREPSGYGPQLQTEAVLGKIEERLPYRKLEELFARQGVPMSLATLQGLVWAASESLEGTYEEILGRIRQAAVVYADETSFRVGGEKWWLWTFTTLKDTLLVLRPSRGEDVVHEILGEGFPGKIVVCDGWKAYPHEGWVLQRCWAHLLRVAKAGAEESRRAQELYAALCNLYERLTKNLEGASPRARVRRLALGERTLDGLVERFGKSWAGGVSKVMTYLANGRSWWLTFLKRPGVEPTNNRGERSIREAVVIRKIIGTLRNEQGAKAFARLLTVLGTWKLRGRDPTRELYAALS